MNKRDIIVIVGSTGGLQALRQLCSECIMLTRDFRTLAADRGENDAAVRYDSQIRRIELQMKAIREMELVDEPPLVVAA